MAAKIKKYPKICRMCGKEFTSKGTRAFLCSDICRLKWMQVRNDDSAYEHQAKSDLERYAEYEKKRNAKPVNCAFCYFKKIGACKGGKIIFQQTSSAGGVYIQMADERCLSKNVKT